MRRLLVPVFSTFVLASLAMADGVGPLRKMTEAEASTFTNLRDTMQSALPAAPDGYKFEFAFVSECDAGMLPEAIGPGDSFPMSFQAVYTFDSSIGGEKQMAAYMDKAKGTPEQQAKLAELNAKEAELRKARDETRDRAEKDRIRAEMKAVNAQADSLLDEIMKQYQAWLAAGGAAATAQDVEKSLPPKELTVWFRVNQTVSVIDTAFHYEVEGMPLAFENAEGCDGYDSYCITLLIGPFEKKDKISGRDRYMLLEATPGVSTKARGVAVLVGGPKDKPEAVREFLQKIDLAKLKSLVI
jgi:hypothetical protein